MKQKKSIHKLCVFVMILTLAVLSCSGAADIPGLLATDTPTPTLTLTLTPSPTATATQTPSPTLPPTGVMVEEQSDGSTVFTDYDNSYRLTLPENWYVIPLSSADLSGILDDLASKNPDFEDLAATFRQLDPDIIRAIAVNVDADYVYNGFSTNLTITALEDKVLSTMPMDFVTGALENSLEQQGATLLSEANLVETNSNGVEVGAFEYRQNVPTATGNTVQVRSGTLLFQANGKLLVLQLATPQQFGDELMPLLDTVTDSIKLLNP